MGVSIECYRSRIGTFKNASCSKLKSTNEMYPNHTKNVKLKQNFSKFIAVISVLLLISVQTSNSSESVICIHPLGRNTIFDRKHFQPSGKTYQGEKSLVNLEYSSNHFHPCGRKLSHSRFHIHNLSKAANGEHLRNLHPYGKRFHPNCKTAHVGKIEINLFQILSIPGGRASNTFRTKTFRKLAEGGNIAVLQ